MHSVCKGRSEAANSVMINSSPDSAKPVDHRKGPILEFEIILPTIPTKLKKLNATDDKAVSLIGIQFPSQIFTQPISTARWQGCVSSKLDCRNSVRLLQKQLPMPRPLWLGSTKAEGAWECQTYNPNSNHTSCRLVTILKLVYCHWVKKLEIPCGEQCEYFCIRRTTAVQ